MSYRPGQGLSDEAVARLKARKTAAGVDVPAEDSNAQWDRLLGTDAKKKLRCSVCTRPLSEGDQQAKRVLCANCTGSGVFSLDRAAVAHLELGCPIFYYCMRHVKPQARSEAPKAVEKNVSAPAAPVPQRTLPVLPRGVSIQEHLGLVVKSHLPLSILSVNLLSHCYVRVANQPWNAFAHCEEAHLAWELRQPRLAEMLRASKADVLCLQEVTMESREGDEEWQLPAWLRNMEGYTAVQQGFKAKEWEKQAERNQRVCGHRNPTGVATLFRSDRFTEAAPCKFGSGSGLAVFLRCLDAVPGGEGSMEVAVGNLHLIGDPERSAEQLKALNSLKKNLGKQDLRIICGDLNSECEPGSDLGKWFAEEGYSEVPCGSSWAEPQKSLRLDHIFSRRLEAVACTDGLTPEEVASGLPCSSVPSDHLPVAALFGAVVKTKCPW
ncbi:unnamed protein product [Effrenium voratum]|uniref:Endonuclease/exonuclease/phosphatase domain-containing protein n=1 Tax=Effrenium voratum TaxID=2562239 RepID=A0AA36IW09_9DINO|nr:unnamed protein product [Effrenium voratum]